MILKTHAPPLAAPSQAPPSHSCTHVVKSWNHLPQTFTSSQIDDKTLCLHTVQVGFLSFPQSEVSWLIPQEKKIFSVLQMFFQKLVINNLSSSLNGLASELRGLRLVTLKTSAEIFILTSGSYGCIFTDLQQEPSSLSEESLKTQRTKRHWIKASLDQSLIRHRCDSQNTNQTMSAPPASK